MGSNPPLLLLGMKAVGYLLCDQGGVAAGPVVDNEVQQLAFYYFLNAANFTAF
jgi:hypothetical protein